MHAAKGLEFPSVFVIAVEAGILPHERSQEDIHQLEEERRLLFVGITRAQSQLVLSYARHRDYRGRSRRCVPSSFLMELRGPSVGFEQEQPLTWPVPNELAEYAADRLPSAPYLATGEEIRSRRTASGELSLEPTECADPDADVVQPPAETHDGEEPRRAPPLITAAELLGQPVEPTETDSTAFQLGGLVMHPVHGPGKVVQLSGQGKRQTAAVQFIQSSQVRKYRVAFSPLKPIQPSGP
jgi:DNA helicase-2/ATP-dependent DNA helicase PcrA